MIENKTLVNPDAIPTKLREREQWVLWRKESREKSDGKTEITKVLYNARTGGKAMSNMPSTWSTVEVALDAYRSSDKWNGIGYVLDNDVTMLDLDHVLEDGRLMDEYRWILDESNTYFEISPSGDGLHGMFDSPKPDGYNRCKRHQEHGVVVEMYDHARFCTFTGNVFEGHSTLTSDSTTLSKVYEKYLTNKERGGKSDGKKSGFKAKMRTAAETQGGKNSAQHDVSLSDSEVVDKMLAGANGNEIRALMDGDASAYNDDLSSADLALMNHLAYWTNGNRDQMERIARTSGLLRSKWDSPRPNGTYLSETIDRALQDFTPYEPTDNRQRRGSKYDMPISNSGKPVFNQVIACKYLTEKLKACLLDGVPAFCTDGRYTVNADATEEALIRRYPFSKRHERRETQALFRVLAPKREQADRELVAFANGILNPRDLNLAPFSEDTPIPYTIPWAWDANAHCEAVDTALDNMCNGDSAMKLNLMELAGLAMSRMTEPPVIGCMLGTGSNGKSLFFKMLEHATGSDNTTHLQPWEFGSQFQMKDLAGRALNIGDDASSDKLSSKTCAALKNITNAAGTRSDVKGRDAIEFRNTATIFFSFNTMPQVADTTEGFMRRLVPLEFTAHFTPDSDGYDPDILRKVTTPEAAQRFCVLAIEGLRRVIKRGTLTPNERAQTIKNGIKTENNTTILWLSEKGYTVGDIVGRETTDVYGEYLTWVDRVRIDAASPISFGKTICRELGIESRVTNSRRVYEKKPRF